MTKSIERNSFIKLRLHRTENGAFQIDERETMRRTKGMIAFDKGLEWNDISVRDNLGNDLNYTDPDKKDLKILIENVYFRDVEAVADKNDLVRATTVGDLAGRIFDNYINESHKKG